MTSLTCPHRKKKKGTVKKNKEEADDLKLDDDFKEFDLFDDDDDSGRGKGGRFNDDDY